MTAYLYFTLHIRSLFTYSTVYGFVYDLVIAVSNDKVGKVMLNRFAQPKMICIRPCDSL